MRAIFGEQHFGQKLRASPAPRDRMGRRRRFGDLFADAAREGFAHVGDDFPMRRHALKRFSRVFAELADAVAATMAARARRGMHHALAGQMGWQGATRGLFFFCLDRRRGLRGDHGRGLGLRRACDQLIELQFQLIEKPRPLFRRCAEGIAPHFRNRQFQLCNLAVKIDRTGIGRNQQRLQGSDIVRKGCRIERHARGLHCFALARDLWPVCFLRGAPVDPFQHIAELSR